MGTDCICSYSIPQLYSWLVHARPRHQPRHPRGRYASINVKSRRQIDKTVPVLATIPVELLPEPTIDVPALAVATPTPIDTDSAKMFIYNHESGNNPAAVNEIGACGLGQALPCSKMPCSLADYQCQDNWFTNSYMIPRYGSWENAKAFWLKSHWW